MIIYRGTQVHNIEALKKDILTDMKIEQQNTNYFPEDVKIHTGFNESKFVTYRHHLCHICNISYVAFKGYLSVRDELLEILNQKYNDHHSKIRIIGHSLGGALATIMALDIIWNVKWVAKIRENVLVRTFGCPCVGNAYFVGFFNEQVIDSNRYFITLDPGNFLYIPREFSRINFSYFRNL